VVGRGEPLLRLVPALRRSLDQVVSHAAAWELSNAEVLAGGPSGAPVWVVLGDSTAQGVGVADLADGYVRRVAHLLERRDATAWRVVNLSRSGAVLADVLDAQLVQLEALLEAGWEPALVSVVAGANDLRRARSPDLVAQLLQVLGRLPARSAVATLPRGLREPRARAANAVLVPEAQARGLRVIDLWAVTGPPWRGKYADGLHPGAAGTTDWVRAFAAALDLPAELDPPSPRPRRAPRG